MVIFDSHHVKLLCSQKHLVLKGLQLSFQVLNFPKTSTLNFIFLSYRLHPALNRLQFAYRRLFLIVCLIYLSVSRNHLYFIKRLHLFLLDLFPTCSRRSLTCSRRPTHLFTSSLICFPPVQGGRLSPVQGGHLQFCPLQSLLLVFQSLSRHHLEILFLFVDIHKSSSLIISDIIIAT